MAWRIHDHVLRGEIDNRIRHRVTGRIWLAGLPEPLVLDLTGDCHPDVAGCVLTFANPAPLPMTTCPPATEQRGTAGDITAARKVRVFDIPMEEAYPMLKRGEKVPEHMANCLYLEWFSDRSGRVVIESTDYQLEISEPAWCFTPEEIAERERHAAEDDTPFATVLDADGNEETWDEFRCEQLLRESDLTGEKYRQLLEKYADHPDSERIIAREMGWEGLEEALAEQETAARDEAADGDLEEDGEEPPDPAREGIDWVRDDEERIIHPLGKHARDLLYALLKEVKAGEEDLSERDEAIGEFVDQFMLLSVKLRSALSFIARGDRYIDPGMIIAWLKRVLEIHNQVLAAADALTDHSDFPAPRLAYYRAELFQIREDVLAILTRLRTPE
ncbi:MAG: hypothetical protein WDN28_31960 [Chthoniobacter sp.]